LVGTNRQKNHKKNLFTDIPCEGKGERVKIGEIGAGEGQSSNRKKWEPHTTHTQAKQRSVERFRQNFPTGEKGGRPKPHQLGSYKKNQGSHTGEGKRSWEHKVRQDGKCGIEINIIEKPRAGGIFHRDRTMLKICATGVKKKRTERHHEKRDKKKRNEQPLGHKGKQKRNKASGGVGHRKKIPDCSRHGRSLKTISGSPKETYVWNQDGCKNWAWDERPLRVSGGGGAGV